MVLLTPKSVKLSKFWPKSAFSKQRSSPWAKSVFSKKKKRKTWGEKSLNFTIPLNLVKNHYVAALVVYSFSSQWQVFHKFYLKSQANDCLRSVYTERDRERGRSLRRWSK